MVAAPSNSSTSLASGQKKSTSWLPIHLFTLGLGTPCSLHIPYTRRSARLRLKGWTSL